MTVIQILGTATVYAMVVYAIGLQLSRRNQ